ncbi:cellulose biosynthesis cyclic di-GMP-binding regulatory protein BcsB, partial [Eisenbergiella porci]|uniref:cellulose biosynthesis cyclic di-GMP-binding regulatory protein BcsB n=1 Tax=Eisenbergiella porci TaxID=2652274 RepID=UPI002A81DE57
VFSIPPDIEIYGDFQVEIIFDFQAGDEWCRLTPEDTPWAVILDTSMLKLTAVDNMSLSFENFPAPFVRDGSMNNLQIIMPDENKDEDMQVMAGLLLTMGRYLKDNRGSLAVKKVEDAYSAEANRIVIGKLGGENLRDELNLPVSVNSGMAFLRRSAYGEESEAVLTITGEGAGMLHTLNYFGNTERLWEIKGDTFLTDGESLYCYRMTPETDEPAAPEAASESVSQKGPMLLIAISISCLVLLASVMLLIKYGRRESDEK